MRGRRVAAAVLALGAVLAGCSRAPRPGPTGPTVPTTEAPGPSTPTPGPSTPTPGPSTPTPGPSTPTPGGGTRNPVIFVHGFGGGPSNWTSFESAMRSAGYPANYLSAIQYNSTAAISASSPILSQEVDRVRARTGAAKVDIVSHSMGSFVSKHCILVGGCVGKVGHWVSLAGVDNGANQLVIALGTAADNDVQGRTPLRAELQSKWGGITTQGIRVKVFYSNSDTIVGTDPGKGGRSQEPPPAENQLVAGLDHISFLRNTTVIQGTISFLAR